MLYQETTKTAFGINRPMFFLCKLQTYVAITQAIKEVQSGGRFSGRVEYTVRNSELLTPGLLQALQDPKLTCPPYIFTSKTQMPTNS